MIIEIRKLTRLPMEKPVLIPVQLTSIVTAEQLAATIRTASQSGKCIGPKASTLNNIRAFARAYRPL